MLLWKDTLVEKLYGFNNGIRLWVLNYYKMEKVCRVFVINTQDYVTHSDSRDYASKSVWNILISTFHNLLHPFHVFFCWRTPNSRRWRRMKFIQQRERDKKEFVDIFFFWRTTLLKALSDERWTGREKENEIKGWNTE